MKSSCFEITNKYVCMYMYVIICNIKFIQERSWVRGCKLGADHLTFEGGGVIYCWQLQHFFFNSLYRVSQKKVLLFDS